MCFGIRAAFHYKIQLSLGVAHARVGINSKKNELPVLYAFNYDKTNLHKKSYDLVTRIAVTK